LKNIFTWNPYGKLPIEKLTRDAGLRDKVEELFSKEKVH
jgi:hypothetical protein